MVIPAVGSGSYAGNKTGAQKVRDWLWPQVG
jgi:hypothetical protein